MDQSIQKVFYFILKTEALLPIVILLFNMELNVFGMLSSYKYCCIPKENIQFIGLAYEEIGLNKSSGCHPSRDSFAKHKIHDVPEGNDFVF